MRAALRHERRGAPRRLEIVEELRGWRTRSACRSRATHRVGAPESGGHLGDLGLRGCDTSTRRCGRRRPHPRGARGAIDRLCRRARTPDGRFRRPAASVARAPALRRASPGAAPRRTWRAPRPGRCRAASRGRDGRAGRTPRGRVAGERRVAARRGRTGREAYALVDKAARFGREQRLIERRQRLLQRARDLHHHEQRRGESAPGFEPADGALADTGAAPELLLRQAEELAHAARVPAEAPHPVLPRLSGLCRTLSVHAREASG